MTITDKLEAILWNIALPGFAQLLNRKFVKGIIFIFLVSLTLNSRPYGREFCKVNCNAY